MNMFRFGECGLYLNEGVKLRIPDAVCSRGVRATNEFRDELLCVDQVGRTMYPTDFPV
jgi:hypothetical protein